MKVSLLGVRSGGTGSVDMITKGQLPVTNGWARSVGSEMDGYVRRDLRRFAREEGLPDNPGSSLMAINRRIQHETEATHGYPDNRLGKNLYLDTTLARKGVDTPQLRRWNDIEPGPTIIVRPTKQYGGAYVLPAAPRRAKP